MLQFSGI